MPRKFRDEDESQRKNRKLFTTKPMLSYEEEEEDFVEPQHNENLNYQCSSDEELYSLENSIRRQISKERNENLRKEAEIELCYIQREIIHRRRLNDNN